MTQKDAIDFVALKASYDVMKPGHKAEVRRARNPESLTIVSSYYRLLPKGTKSDARWKRVVFFLPHAAHEPDGGNIGEQLAKKKISEMRVFQMARSEGENALIHLKRLCGHIEARVDWQKFGETLYFWGERSKQKIVEDYFMNGGGK